MLGAEQPRCTRVEQFNGCGSERGVDNTGAVVQRRLQTVEGSNEGSGLGRAGKNFEVDFGQDAERAEVRSSMIGTASRAEKIRTYRFKENIAVDHRLKSSFNLGEVMQGQLGHLVEALIEQETARRLAEL